MRLRTITTSLLGIAAALALTAAPAMAATGGHQGGMAARVSYETDTGQAWYLDRGPATHTDTAVTAYADAGIVYYAGLAKDFTGIQFSGTGQLGANIWLGDGDQAYTTPGAHPFATDPVNFSYGPYGQVFWTGDQAGKPATVDYIKTLGDTEVYAWVGISGGTSQTGHVDALPGVHPAANLTITITDTGNTATAR